MTDEYAIDSVPHTKPVVLLYSIIYIASLTKCCDRFFLAT